jgi:4-hydroxy-3-polyprenylbenzoate decarboxylase
MTTLAEAGAIICPASPSYYSKPQSMNDLAMTVVNRVLDLSNIESGGFRWGE